MAESLRRKIISQKGCFTRYKNQLAKLDLLTGGDKAFYMKRVEDIGNKVDDIAEMYDELKILEDKPETEKESAEAMAILESELNGVFQRANLRVFPSSNRTLFKVQSDLKPFILTDAHTPLEMRDWLSTFQAYHLASGMGSISVQEQQAFFLARIEKTLLNALRREITPSTSIEGCYRLVEQRFIRLYPLFGRRLEYFRTERKGLTMRDFYVKLTRIGDEAELHEMSVDDLHKFQMIYKSRDDGPLFTKLMELRDPSLEDVLAAATAIEEAKAVQASAAEPICAVEEISIVQNRCQNCGDSGHEGGPCRARYVTCFACHREGHTERMCPERGRRHIDRPRTPERRGRSPERFNGHPTDRGYTRGRYHSRDFIRDSTPAHRDRGHRSPSFARISTVLDSYSSATPPIKVECKFSDQIIQTLMATPDTGAARTVLPLSIVPSGVVVGPSQTQLTAANGSPIINAGCIKMIMRVISLKGVGRTATINAVASPDIKGLTLIGWRDLIKLGVLPTNFPAPITEKVSRVQSVQISEILDENKIEDTLEACLKDFPDVMCTSLGDAAGTILGKGPVTIEIDETKEIRPCQVTTARQTPLHFQEKADRLQNELISSGAIVPCDKPTEWTSPAHFVLKPDGENLRLVTDYRQLNKAVKRPIHPFASASDLMKRVLPSSRWFIKLDAKHGYFQVPLDHASSLLTTFLLPSGRWRYTVMPMGLISSMDEFNLRTDKPMMDLSGWLLKLVDDMLIQARTKSELLQRLRIVLERCKQTGIKLSLSKLEMGQSVKFAGYIVSADGIKPDPAKLASIQEFPSPKSVSELRSFLGLANQLGSFLPDLAHTTVMMRSLLKKGNAFTWLPEHEEEFKRARNLLCSSEIVKPFDPSLNTELLTDASRLHGLGYA